MANAFKCDVCGRMHEGRPHEVVSIRHERLDEITPADVVREGFPEMTPLQFIEMFCETHQGCTPATIVNRIEFKYL